MSLPKGIIAASLTPFNSDLTINHQKLINHCEWLLSQGCNGLCILGTTGEANSMSLLERLDLIRYLSKAELDPGLLLIGTGCCSLEETRQLTKAALEIGVSNVLILPPFYYKNVSDDGIYSYFEQLIEKINDPVLNMYLYHFPQMTGVGFSAELTGKLIRAFPDVIVGMKDSGRSWDHMEAICNENPDFELYAGTESLLTRIISAGGQGSISATANITAGLASKVVDNESTDEESLMIKVRQVFEQYPFIPGLKHIFAKWHDDQSWCYMRPPQVQLSPEQKARLETELQELHFRI